MHDLERLRAKALFKCEYCGFLITENDLDSSNSCPRCGIDL